MVAISGTREQQSTDPVAEQCTTMARIYHDNHSYSRDIKRLHKHGWKVAAIQQQRIPLRIERIRADCPGTLTHFSTREMVIFYTRCRIPQDNRLKRLVVRRHA